MPAIPGQTERNKNSPIHHNIRLIMKHIRPYGLTLRFAYHPALERYQNKCANKCNDRYNDADAGIVHWCRRDEMLNAGEKQEQRRTGYKHALRQCGQRLRFTVPKGVLFIRWLQRVTDDQQVGQ